MKLNSILYGALFLCALSLSSCDKDEVIVEPTSAEEIISLVNQYQPVKIFIDFGTNSYEFAEYNIEDGIWLITLVRDASGNVLKQQYWNLSEVSRFDIMEEGKYFVLSFIK